MNKSWLLIERIDTDVLYGHDILSNESVSVALPDHGTVGKEALKHQNSSFSGIEGFQANGAQVVISHENLSAVDNTGRKHITADYLQVMSQPEIKNTLVKHQVREGAMRLFVYGQGRNDKGTVLRPITTQADLKRVVEATVHSAKNPNPPLRVIIQELGLTRAKQIDPDESFFKGATQVWNDACTLIQKSKTQGLGAGLIFRACNPKTGKVSHTSEFYAAKIDGDTDLNSIFNQNRSIVGKAYCQAKDESLQIEVIPFISYSMGKESARSLARQLNSSPFQLESFGKWALSSESFAGAAFQAQIRQNASGGKYIFATNNHYRWGDVTSLADMPSTSKMHMNTLKRFKPFEKFMVQYKTAKQDLKHKYLKDMTDDLPDQAALVDNVVPMNLTKAVTPAPQRQQARETPVPLPDTQVHTPSANIPFDQSLAEKPVPQEPPPDTQLKAASPRTATNNLKDRVNKMRDQYREHQEEARKKAIESTR